MRRRGAPTGPSGDGIRRAVALTFTLAFAGCGAPADSTPKTAPKAVAPAASPDPAAVEAEAEARRLREIAHQVVFADRIRYAYLLLLEGEGPPGPPPTREELQAMVREAFAGHEEDPEVRLLLQMVAREPVAAGAAGPRLLADLAAASAGDESGAESGVGIGSAGAESGAGVGSAGAESGAGIGSAGAESGAGADTGAVEVDPAAYRKADELLALHVDLVDADAVVNPEALADPLLTRDLDGPERASLPRRRHALLLRGEYRNQHGVRGLRLLQTLVRVVARRRAALIHDPDTLETVGPAVFDARRLQASLGNIADQVVVVPLPEASGDRFRLVTRGMRRFGSVDLELGGLAGEPGLLQRATYLLHGLALVLVRHGEVDRSGIAVSAPETVRVETRDAIDAYAGRPGKLPRCEGCPEAIDLHLVERPPEPQDPPGHVVARVVAPRAQSDAPGYDQAAWARGVIERLFGPG